MDFEKDLRYTFSIKNFKKSFGITWFNISVGFLLLFVFILLSNIPESNSSLYYFIRNIGIFLLFNSLLVAYAGVHRMNVIFYEKDVSIRECIKDILKRAHYILAITLGIILLVSVVVSLELGVSLIGHIPYIGPIFILLLTIPFYLANLFSLLISLCAVAVTPPMVGEGKSLRDVFKNFVVLVKSKWLYILLYVIISLVFFILCLKMVYYITGYSGGITKTLQWKINAAYPKFLNAITARSYIADIVQKVSPKPDSLQAFKEYGFKIFDYLKILKYTIGFLYYVLISIIISFPFAAYFNISSIFYKSIKYEE